MQTRRKKWLRKERSSKKLEWRRWQKIRRKYQRRLAHVTDSGIETVAMIAVEVETVTMLPAVLRRRKTAPLSGPLALVHSREWLSLRWHSKVIAETCGREAGMTVNALVAVTVDTLRGTETSKTETEQGEDGMKQTTIADVTEITGHTIATVQTIVVDHETEMQRIVRLRTEEDREITNAVDQIHPIMIMRLKEPI